MARLIEFFTRTGELVLDPFAGVGGTLLGAAIAQGPRRALGIELEPRWAAIYADVVRDLLAERDGAGPLLADLGPVDPAGVRSFDPSGCEMRVGDALALMPELADGSVDFVATDPPYNIQLALTMAGGPLSETHANRRTDYAMVTQDPADFANSADYPAFLDRMTLALAEIRRVLRPGGYACVIVRDAYQDGRYWFTGADLAARAATVGLVPKGDLDLVPGRHAPAPVRLPDDVRAEHRPSAHPRAPARRSRQTGRGGSRPERSSRREPGRGPRPRSSRPGGSGGTRSAGPCRPRRTSDRRRPGATRGPRRPRRPPAPLAPPAAPVPVPSPPSSVSSVRPSSTSPIRGVKDRRAALNAPEPPSYSTTSPRVMRWTQPRLPSGQRMSQYPPDFSRELDLVALVEVADRRGPKRIGRIEQAHRAVADLAPLGAGRPGSPPWLNDMRSWAAEAA